MGEAIERALGLSLRAGELEFSHMAWRAVVVFVFAVALARIADRRFLGHNAGYDIMLGVILGSVVSRAINGDAAFFPTLGATALLIFLHHLLCTAAFRWHKFSLLVKGRPRILIQNGAANPDELRRNKITRSELDENLRLNGQVVAASEVAEARLEQNGRISVIPQKPR